MIAYILAVSLFALQGAAGPGGQNSDSSGKSGAHRKQSGSERNSGRPRLAHPPADGPSQEIRLLNLVPKSPAFSVVRLQTKDSSAGSQQSPAASQGSPSDPGSHTLPEMSSRSGLNHRGGLWLTGNVQEGMARLAWIAGPENAGLLTIDKSGQVRIDESLLGKKAESSRTQGQSPALALSLYILSNEGLLLLEQLTQGHRKYHLHIGDRVLTAGGEVEVKSVLNLDNNFDGRINSYRPKGVKMPSERPSQGFDALISINPDVVWYNLGYQRVISPGIVTFHELAEAHAKLEYGLEYLPNGLLPGAHSVAVEREFRLQSQRPALHNAITAGENLSINAVQESRKRSTRFAAFLGSTR